MYVFQLDQADDVGRPVRITSPVFATRVGVLRRAADPAYPRMGRVVWWLEIPSDIPRFDTVVINLDHRGLDVVEFLD